ncbi:hypothetical protein RBG61_05935 [Paludicola sp. MB14-C6]|uniref:hypothetical protein n=1 Tax=Paludihabitans sp. MB14-C6 TaxID=3070656 RepID=UPI0027DAC4CF|nr:hypothetical protein [Paludicola sp. MB14-C6]WMJ24204.1 hypothetical protein RBG61_05935 [Paludicola sp. MB14-C6]
MAKIHNKHNRIILIGICATISILILLSTGCNSKVDEKCQKSIAMVISNMFTCPNSEVIQYLEEPIVGVPDSKNSDVIIGGTNENYEKYIDTNYIPYMTQEALTIFRQSFNDVRYHSIANESGHTISVKSIRAVQQKESTANYTKSEKAKRIITYEFSAILLCGPKDGQQSEYQISGSAYCTPEGFVSYFRILNDGGIRDLLIKKINQ